MTTNFKAIGDAATNGDAVSRLYWMALGRLMSAPGYTDKTPEDIHSEIVGLAADVYGNERRAGSAQTDIAASAYRAYAASTGNKNFRGEPMPAFDDLPLPIQTAWEAAVRQAENCHEYGVEASAAFEQGWQGWVRPQDRPDPAVAGT